MQCPTCKEYIRGTYEVKGVAVVGFEFLPPRFCEYCGNPFPWTESALSAAKELADSLEALNDDEKEELKKTSTTWSRIPRELPSLFRSSRN